MTSIRFDHFITYADTPSIDTYLDEYRSAGFLVAEETVRHEPGLRNGFIMIGPEYLEFCWVEDEDLFAAVDAGESEYRAAHRPWGTGLVADDVRAVHDDWAARGYAVSAVWSKGPRDAAADAPPVWSFQDLPPDELPGVLGFVLKYHVGSRVEHQGEVRLAPNSIYGFEGLTLVAADPDERARRWRDLLAPDALVETDGNSASVLIEPHRATWITADTYAARYGLRWKPAPHRHGELAILHLLTHDLAVCRQMLERAGRRVRGMAEPVENPPYLVVEPDSRDGFAFTTGQRAPEEWLRERVARTGEPLRTVAS